MIIGLTEIAVIVVFILVLINSARIIVLNKRVSNLSNQTFNNADFILDNDKRINELESPSVTTFGSQQN